MRSMIRVYSLTQQGQSGHIIPINKLVRIGNPTIDLINKIKKPIDHRNLTHLGPLIDRLLAPISRRSSFQKLKLDSVRHLNNMSLNDFFI